MKNDVKAMTQEENAITVKDLRKTFRLPHERLSGLKQGVVNFFRFNRGFEEQKVLDGISFEVKKGEFFGIVGRNGSGKSTLLKLLAGIYTPDSGSVQINGSLTPFIELGVGFNHELTGRENVFLNGAMLGFSRQEVAGMYDQIVEFAELERFMDQKLKNYSSGMQVRLAFAIAVRAQSDILLIDEVLAVGDSSFQAKCFKHFRKLKREKQTVVLVTHDMGIVQEYCDRALLLESGDIKSIGKPGEVASLYTLENAAAKLTKEAQEAAGEASNNAEHGITLLGVEIDGNKAVFDNDDTISFVVKYRLTKKFPHRLGISIIKNGLSIYERNTKDTALPNQPGEHKVRWSGPVKPFTAGLHYISVAVFTENDFQLVGFIAEANKFIIEKSKKGGVLDMESGWQVING
jgi:ABC-2 type transport system ATP-binding protein